MTRVRGHRPIARPFTIRRLLALVALAALASLGLVKFLALREFRVRAGPSEKLLRPIIAYHESGLHSDLTCSQSNAGSARGHLSRTLRHLGSAFRAIKHDHSLPRGSPVTSRFKIPARDSLMYARAEWQFFGQTCRLVEKQRLMAAYHARLGDYYLGLLAEHRVVVPPLPVELLAERLALTARLRMVCDDSKLDLDPEPLPQFLPGWKPPPGQPNARVGDSY